MLTPLQKPMKETCGNLIVRQTFYFDFYLSIFSSHEHKVLKVSCCDQSMPIVRRSSCCINNCFKSLLLLHS